MTLLEYIKMINSNPAESFSIYELADTYYRYLLAMVISRFEYHGTDESGLNTEALETILITQGKCLIIKKGDKLIAVPFTSEFGMDNDRAIYASLYPYMRYSDAIYANPIIGSDTLEIGSNCVMAYNTLTSFRMSVLLKKSALILAQIDKSLELSSVNLRSNYIFLASTTSDKESIETFYKKLYEGVAYVPISDGSLFDEIKQLPVSDTRSNSLSELITARNNEMRNICRLMGISMAKDKSQAILSDEVESDDDYLSFTIKQMIDSRKKMCEDINNVFGTDISCILLNVSRETFFEENEEEKEVNNNDIEDNNDK